MGEVVAFSPRISHQCEDRKEAQRERSVAGGGNGATDGKLIGGGRARHEGDDGGARQDRVRPEVSFRQCLIDA